MSRLLLSVLLAGALLLTCGVSVQGCGRDSSRDHGSKPRPVPTERPSLEPASWGPEEWPEGSTPRLLLQVKSQGASWTVHPAEKPSWLTVQHTTLPPWWGAPEEAVLVVVDLTGQLPGSTLQGTVRFEFSSFLGDYVGEATLNVHLIVAPPDDTPPVAFINSPQAGDVLQGDLAGVRYSTYDANPWRAKIEVSKNDGATWTTLTEWSLDRWYTWDVSAEPASNTYRVRVTPIDKADNVGEPVTSETFGIDPGPVTGE